MSESDEIKTVSENILETDNIDYENENQIIDDNIILNSENKGTMFLENISDEINQTENLFESTDFDDIIFKKKYSNYFNLILKDKEFQNKNNSQHQIRKVEDNLSCKNNYITKNSVHDKFKQPISQNKNRNFFEKTNTNNINYLIDSLKPKNENLLHQKNIKQDNFNLESPDFIKRNLDHPRNDPFSGKLIN